MTISAWAHLPNASLIDALVAASRYTSLETKDAVWAIVFSVDVAHSAFDWGDASRACDCAGRRNSWECAWEAAQGSTWGASWAVGALVAWDDMPAFIALSDPELEALRKIANGTDTALRAVAAQIYNMVTRRAKEKR